MSYLEQARKFREVAHILDDRYVKEKQRYFRGKSEMADVGLAFVVRREAIRSMHDAYVEHNRQLQTERMQAMKIKDNRLEEIREDAIREK